MRRNNGFTLLEVLVSVVVLAFGLLGLAGLQGTGLKNNRSALYRSQATMLAYDLADRMRSNVLAVQAGTYVSALPNGTSRPACKTSSGCTSTQMAENDIFEWQTALGGALPMGAGTMSLSGSMFTITVNWDDNKDGSVNNDDPNLQVSFQL